jgi:hypothetical protein
VKAFDHIGGFIQLHKYITAVTLSELMKGLEAVTKTSEAAA